MRISTATCHRLIVLSAVFLLLGPVTGRAEESYEPKLSISDGKDGRPWANWTQVIKEHPVKSIKVVLRKESGGDKTFVNLRFEGGETFEGGKRVYLTDDKLQGVTWQLDGQSPGGKPLVLNAYEGVVFVKRVIIEYQ